MLNLLFPIFNVGCVIVFVVMSFRYWKSHCVLRELLDKGYDLEKVIAKAERCKFEGGSGNYEEIERIKARLVELSTLVQKTFSKGNNNERNIAEMRIELEALQSDMKALKQGKKNKKGR